MKVDLKTYDHKEYKELEEYYKKQVTEDYLSAASRIEKINLHADFIVISENLWDSRKRCYQSGKELMTWLLDRLAICLWKGEDYLDEVTGIFEQYDFENMEQPSIEEGSEEKKVYNTILNQCGYVLHNFCSHYHFQEALSALKIMIQDDKELLTRSDDYFFPGEGDEVYWRLKNRYEEYFEICARLYPLSHLVEIINRKGYEYKIIEEDFRELEKSKRPPKNALYKEMKELKKEFEQTRKIVEGEAKKIIKDDGDPSNFMTPKGDANAKLYNGIIDRLNKKGIKVKLGSVRTWLRNDDKKLREELYKSDYSNNNK